MAVVHLTTISCEPCTAYKVEGVPKSYFCTNDIVYLKFEGFRTFLCIFRIVFFSVLSYEMNNIYICSLSLTHYQLEFGMYESNGLSTAFACVLNFLWFLNTL